MLFKVLPEDAHGTIWSFIASSDLARLSNVSKLFRTKITNWIHSLFPNGTAGVVVQLFRLASVSERRHLAYLNTLSSSLVRELRVYRLFHECFFRTRQMHSSLLLIEDTNALDVLRGVHNKIEPNIEDWPIYQQRNGERAALRRDNWVEYRNWKRVENWDRHQQWEEGAHAQEFESDLEPVARFAVEGAAIAGEVTWYALGRDEQTARDELRMKCLSAIEWGYNEEEVQEESRQAGIVLLRTLLWPLREKNDFRIDFTKQRNLYDNDLRNALLAHAFEKKNPEALALLFDLVSWFRVVESFFVAASEIEGEEEKYEAVVWFIKYLESSYSPNRCQFFVSCILDQMLKAGRSDEVYTILRRYSFSYKELKKSYELITKRENNRVARRLLDISGAEAAVAARRFKHYLLFGTVMALWISLFVVLPALSCYNKIYGTMPGKLKSLAFFRNYAVITAQKGLAHHIFTTFLAAPYFTWYVYSFAKRRILPTWPPRRWEEDLLFLCIPGLETLVAERG